MSTEENKAQSRRFMEEVLNKHDVSILNQFMVEDFVDHNQFPGLPQGIEGQRQLFSLLFRAFPDQRYTIDDIVAEGDKVVVRSTGTGTHKGEFLGIPPTGKTVRFEGFDMVRLVNGKWVEHWGLFDSAGMMIQLGVMPMPGQPPK